MYWTYLTKTIVEIMYKTGKMLVTILCWFRYVFLNFTGLYTFIECDNGQHGHMLWILIATLKYMQSCVVEILSKFHLKYCHLFFCL